MKSFNLSIFAIAVLVMGGIAPGPAAAQDKVSVGVFPVSSSLPYFVALERGFFKEQNIEPEMTKLMGGPPNVAAMMTNQIEVSAVLVTLEGLNANVKKPGVAMYIALNSQTKVWKMEQFVVRNGFKAETIADLKGAKLFSAPGPANLGEQVAAKSALAYEADSARLVLGRWHRRSMPDSAGSGRSGSSVATPGGTEQLGTCWAG